MPRAAASSTSHRAPIRPRRKRSSSASLDRLGVCNRLNLLLVDRAADELRAARGPSGSGIDGARPERRARVGERPRAHRVGHRARRSSRSTRRCALANEETSGLAATIVTEDEAAAERFLDGYRGTAAFWNATTRFTDGFALTGAPETGINVDRVPGPRGPVTYRDL